jgi:hypothetical protein
MRASKAFLLAMTVLLAACVTQPPRPQVPQLPHREEIAAFEAIVRYKLAQLRFPRHTKVYVDAREIFPNMHIAEAPVEELAHHITSHEIVFVGQRGFPSEQWLQIYLNSTDGEVFFFAVHDANHVNTYRLAKRDGKWTVVGIDPVIFT